MSEDALLVSAVIALALVMSAPTLAQTGADSTVSFPPLSIPERQGMDSNVLAGLFDYIADHSLQIHSLAILRNDHLVLEAYFHPFRPDVAHRIASGTKSITSALIGIAIDKGFIRAVNQPLLEFFEGLEIANRNKRKEKIRLEHVLTMSSGSVRFNFDVSSAEIYLHAGKEAMEIGLDGIHRVRDAGPFGEPRALVGLKGRWEDDRSFYVHIVFLHGARFDTLWNFSDSGVSIEVEEPFGTYRIRGEFQE